MGACNATIHDPAEPSHDHTPSVSCPKCGESLPLQALILVAFQQRASLEIERMRQRLQSCGRASHARTPQ